MSYMIKSPDAKNVKFAHVYLSSNMTDITISTFPGVALNQKCLFDSINASSGIGITVSNGDITLSAKDYIVYVVPTINIVTGTNINNVSGTYNILLTLYLNGVEIVSQSKAEQNCTSSPSNAASNATNTFAGTMGVASFSAQGGDVLSLLLDADNLSTINSLGLRVIGSTDGDPHSLFIWEIDR
jgi:hypothetical protein